MSTASTSTTILKRKREGKDTSKKNKTKLRKVSIDVSVSGTVSADHQGDEDDENTNNQDDIEEESEEEDKDISSLNPNPPSHSRTNLSLSQIQTLKSTGDLYRSNTFKLQIDALLPNIRPSSSHSSTNTLLFTLHTFLTSSDLLPDTPSGVSPLEGKRLLESGEPFSSTTNSKKGSKSKSKTASRIGVQVPYPLPYPTTSTQWTVGFKRPRPEGVVLVGSWATGTSVKVRSGTGKEKGNGGYPYSVDLSVEMPDSLFQEKDYLNSRFFHKKAFYLAYIASAIVNAKSDSKINSNSEPSLSSNLNDLNIGYAYTNDDPRLLKLVLEPRGTSSKSKIRTRICIIPVISPTSPLGFACLGSPSSGLGSGSKLGKLSPTRGNLRVTASTSNQDSDKLDEKDQVKDEHAPTPLYNTALLRSFTPLPHMLATHNIVKDTSTSASLSVSGDKNRGDVDGDGDNHGKKDGEGDKNSAFRDALGLLRVWAGQRGFVGSLTRTSTSSHVDEAGVGGVQEELAQEREEPLSVRGFTHSQGPFWNALLMLVVFGEEFLPGSGKKEKAMARKALGKGLSSYQLFRGVLDFLASHDWENHPVFVRVDTGKGHLFPTSSYTSASRSHPVIFVDSSSIINLLAGVPVGSLKLLSADARKTLDVLDRSWNLGAVSLSTMTTGATSATTATMTGFASGPFPEVFLKDQRDLQTRFDAVVRIDLSTLTLNSQLNPDHLRLHQTLDHGSPTLFLLSSIESILTQGLGNRVKSVVLLVPSAKVQDVRVVQESSGPNVPSSAWIGMIYDPRHAFRQVDYGPSDPSSDSTDSSASQSLTAFRTLWGPKSSLRRFKDGRIQESVVWEVTSVDEKSRIPEMVVAFLMGRWFGLDHSSSISAKGPVTTFDTVVRLPEKVGRYYNTFSGSGAGMVVGTKGALTAFDGLVRAIRGLDSSDGGGGLPLSVMNIHPISDALRYTSAFSPVPVPSSSGGIGGNIASILPSNARYFPTIEFIIEFEKSSRWPDDLGAVQKVKMAFMEKIARGLMQIEKEGTRGMKARVVVGSRGSSTVDLIEEEESGRAAADWDIQDVARLEIVTPEGWAFSGRIWVEREATLLERILDHSNGMPHVKSKSQVPDTTPLTLTDISHGDIRRKAQHGLESYARTYIYAPAHHRAIATLSHRFPAFSGTVRLAKRWFGAHWVLSSAGGIGDSGMSIGSVSEEAVEMLCAWVFLVGGGGNINDNTNEDEEDGQTGNGNGSHSTTMSIPGSKERGFASLIRFLKEWNWEEEGGVHVPLYNSSGVTASLATPKSKSMTSSGAGVWRISTEVDSEGAVWTRHGPDGVVARRVRALAEATWAYWNEAIYRGSTGGDVLAMFTHPTDDYDVLLKLDAKVLTRYHQNVLMDETQLCSSSNDKDDAGPGFDPALALFKDLERIYQDTFRIFYDPFGGDQFGIVWEPSLKEPRPFRVLGGFSSIPSETSLPEADTKARNTKCKNAVVLNEQGILKEIERLGGGIVSSIIIQTRAA